MAATRNRPSPDPGIALREALLGALFRAAGMEAGGRIAGLRCAAALSGGRDSVVLLHVLAGLRAETGIVLSALHVHHGLSPEADRWADFCATCCASLGIPLSVERVQVDRSAGQGIEGAARLVRHAAYRRLPVDVVLLAHHAGDQAETLLFNLLRGAGVNGAAAMATTRRSAAGGPVLLRPWLAQAPAVIEAYCRLHGLRHVEDESNRDTAFSRNFLRHEVLAPVERRFPGATGRLAAAARRIGEARTLLAEVADGDLAAAGDSGRLDLVILSTLGARRRDNALRRWLERRAVVCGEERFEELLRQIGTADADSRVEVRCGEWALRLWRGHLYVVPLHLVQPVSPVRWTGQPAVPWALGALTMSQARGQGFAADFAHGLELRPRQGGERLRLREGGPARPLRLLFQEAALPPWERDAIPLLWQGDRLVAVPGVGVAAECRVGADAEGWVASWERAAR